MDAALYDARLLRQCTETMTKWGGLLMAKMTVQDVTYEGTPEELREIISTFEAKPVDIVSEVSVGDTVRIVTLNGSPEAAAGGFSIGDICNITGRSTGTNKLEIMRDGAVGLRGYVSNHHVEKVTEAKAKPADKLSHKGADYTLVQRKAQADDVVVFTETGGDVFKTGTPYEVGDNVVSKGFAVYRDTLRRTEETVIVYEPIAQLKVGDTVEVIDGSQSRWNDLKTGAIGKITEINVGGRFYDGPIEVTSDDDYDRFPASALRKVVAPVVKQREFKKGDIVRVIRNTGADSVGTIVEIDSDGARSYRRLSGKRDWYGGESKWFELVAPVETRVDTK